MNVNINMKNCWKYEELPLICDEPYHPQCHECMVPRTSLLVPDNVILNDRDATPWQNCDGCHFE